MNQKALSTTAGATVLQGEDPSNVEGGGGPPPACKVESSGKTSI